jgi:hypothetical protein
MLLEQPRAPSCIFVVGASDEPRDFVNATQLIQDINAIIEHRSLPQGRADHDE